MVQEKNIYVPGFLDSLSVFSNCFNRTTECFLLGSRLTLFRSSVRVLTDVFGNGRLTYLMRFHNYWTKSPLISTSSSLEYFCRDTCPRVAWYFFQVLNTNQDLFFKFLQFFQNLVHVWSLSWSKAISAPIIRMCSHPNLMTSNLLLMKRFL